MSIFCRICNSSNQVSKFVQKRKYLGEQIIFDEGKVGYMPFFLCNECKILARKALNAEPPVNPNNWINNLIKSRESGVFRCQITNLTLDIKESSTAHYLSLDHDIATKNRPSFLERNSLVVSQMINDMKSDLNTSEFKKVIFELSKIIKEFENQSNYLPENDVNVNIEHLINFNSWRRSNKENPNKITVAKTRKVKLEKANQKISELERQLSHIKNNRSENVHHS